MFRYRSVLLNVATALYVLTIGTSSLGARGLVNREEVAGRKVKIERASIGVGISSGLVIAYGHPMPAPYKFEYRGHFLFVNNVQVEPSIYRQHEYEKRQNKSSTKEELRKYSEVAELRKGARKLYFEKSGKIPDDRLHAEILEMFLKHPLIESAHWVRADDLNYSSKMAPGVETGVKFTTDPPPVTDNSRKRSPDELRNKRISMLEADLIKGDVLFFMSDGGIWYARSYRIAELKVGVTRIMTQTSLSDDEREAQLLVLFYNAPGPVIDVLANFQPEEWR